MNRVVVLAWGNESRGDDALGPLFLAAAEAAAPAGDWAFVGDFQLQPEHATDLLDRDLALFVDASRVLAAPVALRELAPQRDATFTTHGMSAEAVLAAYVAAFGGTPPPAFELAIRGETFALGATLSAGAAEALAAANALFARMAQQPSAQAWRALAAQYATPQAAIA
ncbi:MAG: hydrogenase maturation protease [Burkholderiales bacterium]